VVVDGWGRQFIAGSGFQTGKKALLPQELHSIPDGFYRDFRQNDQARLSETWLPEFHILL
jgi:hypothetical protein